MTDFLARRYLGRRNALEARYRALVDDVAGVDRHEQQLARQMAALRRDLRELHDRMWPTGVGLSGKSRRSRIGGPSPIPPPARDALAVSGRHLRYAALGVLVRAEQPLSLTDVHRALHLTGYRIAGPQPVKRLADALGYEHDHGRAHRVSRGVYRVGELSPARRRRAVDASRMRRAS